MSPGPSVSITDVHDSRRARRPAKPRAAGVAFNLPSRPEQNKLSVGRQRDRRLARNRDRLVLDFVVEVKRINHAVTEHPRHDAHPTSSSARALSTSFSMSDLYARARLTTSVDAQVRSAGDECLVPVPERPQPQESVRVVAPSARQTDGRLHAKQAPRPPRPEPSAPVSPHTDATSCKASAWSSTPPAM